MKIVFYIANLFLICNFTILQAQTPLTTNQDSVTLSLTKLLQDTLPKRDTTIQFTNSVDSLPSQTDTLSGYKISKDAIDVEVNYGSLDSSWTEVANQRIHLYGGAYVEYQNIKVNAKYILLNFGNNTIEAFDRIDSTEVVKELPTFKEGDRTVYFESLRYNFKSKKGKLREAITQEGEYNIIGNESKFISGVTDSLGNETDTEIFQKNAIVTTCNHKEPHFGIRVHKLKFIPKKVAVMSFAQLELAKVPTPLVIPFGFFPLTTGRSSGLIFPRSYEYNDQLGLGFREIGYYFPVNDYLDMRVTGDIYTRGTYGLRVNANYKKKYSYNGNILLGFSDTKLESERTGEKLSQKSFTINVRHTQDSKAHPYRQLGGSINISSNRYQQRTYENPAAVLTNTYSSNFNFSHSMPGTPFQFNAEFRHSQNTTTRVVDITLPNISLRMNTINPFKQKNRTQEKWYDRVAVTYSSEFKNFTKTTDTTLFSIETLNNLQTGLAQKASINTNFRLLNYINTSPYVSYDEYWLLNKYQRVFDPTKVILDTLTNDTLGFEQPIGSISRDFNTFRNISTGLSFNTQIYGTKKFAKGFIRGFRHLIKPTITMAYKPANKDGTIAIVNTDTRAAFNRPQEYSIFQGSPFGSLTGTEEQFTLNYGIINIFEAKYFSKKDSTEKNVRLFDNISINGNYNFVADSFHWSPISISGTTVVLKGLTNFNFRSTFSPYAYNDRNQITKQTLWDREKKIIEFRNFTGQFSTNISFGKIFDILGINKSKKESPKPVIQQANVLDPQETQNAFRAKPNTERVLTEEEEAQQSNENEEISLADWFSNFNLSHSFNFAVNRLVGRDTFFVSSHSLSITGSIPLTKNWNFNVNNISYDFKNKSLVYPHFSFARDLHCWQMNFTWSPSNGVYSFFIGVKSSTLSFLKYDYGQQNPNTLFTGQR